MEQTTPWASRVLSRHAQTRKKLPCCNLAYFFADAGQLYAWGCVGSSGNWGQLGVEDGSSVWGVANVADAPPVPVFARRSSPTGTYLFQPQKPRDELGVQDLGQQSDQPDEFVCVRLHSAVLPSQIAVCNPYVVAICTEQSLRGRPEMNTNQPEWDETFKFERNNDQASDDSSSC